MITTITLNASVDRRYVIEKLEKNGIHRALKSQPTAGGKGLNVARVVKDLDEKVTVSGFLGGYNGQFIKSQLQDLHIYNKFVDIKGETRNCIAIITKDGSQTEILESGPEILSKELEHFLNKYEQLCKKSNVIVISGSLPSGVPDNIYRVLIEKARQINSNVKTILDTSGSALKEGIKAHPYMIKPNEKEFRTLMSVDAINDSELMEYLKILSRNVELVVVSLGEKGSYVCHSDTIYEVKAPKVKVINSVGSGDAMVAGYAVAIQRGYKADKMIKFATACGSANAMEEATGKVKVKNVKELIEKIEIAKMQKWF